MSYVGSLYKNGTLTKITGQKSVDIALPTCNPPLKVRPLQHLQFIQIIDKICRKITGFCPSYALIAKEIMNLATRLKLLWYRPWKAGGHAGMLLQRQDAHHKPSAISFNAGKINEL
jgi:hypothetical protein